MCLMKARVMQRFSGLHVLEGLSAPLRGKGGRTAARVLQGLLFLAMLAYMAHVLGNIGWRSVLAALPTNPWFYLLTIPLFLALPIADWLSYQAIWGKRFARSLPVFIRKRVYNQGLVGYAGEAYLAWWAVQRGGLRSGEALVHVKDVSVLAASAGNIASTLLALGFLAAYGWQGQTGRLMLAASGFLLLVLVLSAVLRKRIISLPGATLRAVLRIHLIRVAIVLPLQVLQWEAGLPQAPLSAWLLILTAQMLISRVPFLPNRELAGVGAGLSIAGTLAIPAAETAAMLVASGAVMQALNFAAFLATSFGAYAPAPAARRDAGPAPHSGQEAARANEQAPTHV